MDIRVRAKIWLEIEDGVPFCHGKAALLATIRAHGSIRQAAQVLHCPIVGPGNTSGKSSEGCNLP